MIAATIKMRHELTPTPSRMAALPIDERGYPVPWFVPWLDGKPEFRAMDRQKYTDAIKKRLCWVCGQKLGVHLAFVGGPMCGINRTAAEPPNHRECAVWSAINCPFLSNPRMVRREDERELNKNVPGLMIARNPGVTMIWNTRGYEFFDTPTGSLIQMGEPETVEWFANGRRATREEVMESIESGLCSLEAVAAAEKGGLEALERQKMRFDKWIPRA